MDMGMFSVKIGGCGSGKPTWSGDAPRQAALREATELALPDEAGTARDEGVSLTGSGLPGPLGPYLQKAGPPVAWEPGLVATSCPALWSCP